MEENNILHCWIIPIAYTLVWILGICMGSNIFEFFCNYNHVWNTNPYYYPFYSAVTIYCAFLLECGVMFVDWGDKYKDEPLNGKTFFLCAGIFFHFFLTFWLVGVIISHLNGFGVCFLIFWISIFKFGISVMIANVKCLLSKDCIYNKNSRKVI